MFPLLDKSLSLIGPRTDTGDGLQTERFSYREAETVCEEDGTFSTMWGGGGGGLRSVHLTKTKSHEGKGDETQQTL